MLKSAISAVSALAIVAIAAGAVILLQGASESVAAKTPLNSGKGDRLDIRAAATPCSEQAWPYYDARCIKDARQAMSLAKPARIVTSDRLGN